MVLPAYSHDLRSAVGGLAMGGDLQGLPADPEAEHLHARPGIGGDARDRRRNALSGACLTGRWILSRRLTPGAARTIDWRRACREARGFGREANRTFQVVRRGARLLR